MPKKLAIGVTCYPTYGGSGVVATEIGMAMAERGHRVHFIAYDIPRRLDRFSNNVFFHEVEIGEYPLLIHPPYALALTSKIVSVSEQEQLDIVHVHYAIPHATSAYLARQILGPKSPKIVTTLHGTDITLVGNDISYLPITRFSIMQSDGVTTPSQYLRQTTYSKLQIPTSFPIEVIANFVDTAQFSPYKEGDTPRDKMRMGNCACSDKVLVHISNFRPVKRIEDVVAVFEKVQKKVQCHLVLVGDGPERSRIQALVRSLNLQEKVCFLGKQDSVEEILRYCDVFLLPSESESFGLAALEAMSCGVPVIASRAGGIPEVVTHGENGFLSDVKDIDDMAVNTIRLLTDSKLYEKFAEAARQRAVQQFARKELIDQFEAYYYRLLGV